MFDTGIRHAERPCFESCEQTSRTLRSTTELGRGSAMAQQEREEVKPVQQQNRFSAKRNGGLMDELKMN